MSRGAQDVRPLVYFSRKTRRAHITLVIKKANVTYAQKHTPGLRDALSLLLYRPK